MRQRSRLCCSALMMTNSLRLDNAMLLLDYRAVVVRVLCVPTQIPTSSSVSLPKVSGVCSFEPP